MIDLKFICPQSLSGLMPTQNGFFCKDCQKCIVDFRGKSKVEMNDLMRNSMQEVCGIFTKDQVDRPSAGTIRSGFKLAFIAVFILGLSANNLSAQAQIDSSHVSSVNFNLQDNMRVEGFIFNQDSLPVPFAKIKITQGADIYWVKGDLDGYFAIDFKQNGTKYISIEATGIYYDTLVVQQIPTENGQVIVEIYLRPNEEVEFHLMGLISPQEHHGIKPASNPYDFGKTTIDSDDLFHRP